MADQTEECKRKPHFAEILGAALIFVLGITAGGLALGFLTTNQNFKFGNIDTGNLTIYENVDTPVVVTGVSPTLGGGCEPVTFPTETDLNKSKMAITTPPAQGFLAAGIIAIIVGVAGFAHLVSLSHAWNNAPAAAA